MRKSLCLLVVALAVLSVQMLPTQNLWAVACVYGPNTPVEPGSGIDCLHAEGAAYTAAYNWASSYCASHCGRVCSFSFGHAGDICYGTGPYYTSGYANFSCASVSPCPVP